MGFGQGVAFVVFIAACVLGTGGVRLLARGLTGATGPAERPVSDLAAVSAPTGSALRPSPPAQGPRPAPRRPSITLPNAAHLARLADGVKVRFTPVSLETAPTASVPNDRTEPVALAVDPASA